MEQEVKQEGEFKISKTKKPKSLNNVDDIVKVTIKEESIVPEQEVTKVTIPLETKEEEIVIEEIIDEEIKNVEDDPIKDTHVEEYVQKEITKTLPENIEKLVSFMEETGGTLEDYVRLNTDYSTVNENVLLKEYYKNTKPHLDVEEIEFLMEDTFSYDEDIDEERDIRKKKLAFKEEVAKAKKYLETVKDKYYEEIKINSNTNPQQQEAYDFFNRYKKNEEKSKLQHEKFKTQTKNLFNNDFKGFEFNIGEKRFRYGVQNVDQIAEKQSDINNFVKKFLDNDGNVIDQVDYHKALYTAMNSDKIANHFYQQGKADAVKEVVNNSKNPSTTPRQASGEVFINGLKVKAISGFDSSKLRIQTKKFNN